MKKLFVLFQLAGLLAVCPLYYVLEMTHASSKNSKSGQDSSIKQKTEVVKSQPSNPPDNKTQNASDYSITK